MKKLFNIEYFFDNHNVEYLRFQRTGKWFWKIIKYLEKSIIINSRKTLVCSGNDKQYLETHLNIDKTKIQVIPNGVEINKQLWKNREEIRDKIRNKYNLKNEKILLYSGSFYYKPNIEALLYIQEKLIPKLEKQKLPYKFIICGKGFEKYKIKSDYIIYAGLVENIIEYNIAADILVAPLFSGSGTKLKIIEALAYGLRTITTDIGAEGIDRNKFMFVKNKINLQDIKSILEKKVEPILQEEFSWDKCLYDLKLDYE